MTTNIHIKFHVVHEVKIMEMMDRRGDYNGANSNRHQDDDKS